jgi:hypothetical protein
VVNKKGVLDNPLFLCYHIIMKNKKPILKRVRYKNGTDIFYTFTNWSTKEIDGVEYLPVVKSPPDHAKTQVLHYIRKDAMEYVK